MHIRVLSAFDAGVRKATVFTGSRFTGGRVALSLVEAGLWADVRVCFASMVITIGNGCANSVREVCYGAYFSPEVRGGGLGFMAYEL